MGFYISDFAGAPAAFTRSDFDGLVRDGRVTITDRRPAGTVRRVALSQAGARVAQRATASDPCVVAGRAGAPPLHAGRSPGALHR